MFRCIDPAAVDVSKVDLITSGFRELSSEYVP